MGYGRFQDAVQTDMRAGNLTGYEDALTGNRDEFTTVGSDNETVAMSDLDPTTVKVAYESGIDKALYTITAKSTVDGKYKTIRAKQPTSHEAFSGTLIQQEFAVAVNQDNLEDAAKAGRFWLNTTGDVLDAAGANVKPNNNNIVEAPPPISPSKLPNVTALPKSVASLDSPFHILARLSKYFSNTVLQSPPSFCSMVVCNPSSNKPSCATAAGALVANLPSFCLVVRAANSLLPSITSPVTLPNPCLPASLLKPDMMYFSTKKLDANRTGMFFLNILEPISPASSAVLPCLIAAS